ncbi:MAG: hypothetical protein MPJ24_11805 [Pirellulaceae bacterium]|nr:hypothetical protein [Pirellulaceae bacterium]
MEPREQKAGDPKWTNYDFGFRQADGSFIHANRRGSPMKVKIDPTSKEFAQRLNDFTTTLYCVICAPC